MHEAGRTYNDLKPSNIMLEQNFDSTLKIFLIDFGLSKEIEINSKS